IQRTTPFAEEGFPLGLVEVGEEIWPDANRTERVLAHGGAYASWEVGAHSSEGASRQLLLTIAGKQEVHEECGLCRMQRAFRDNCDTRTQRGVICDQVHASRRSHPQVRKVAGIFRGR